MAELLPLNALFFSLNYGTGVPESTADLDLTVHRRAEQLDHSVSFLPLCN